MYLIIGAGHKPFLPTFLTYLEIASSDFIFVKACRYVTLDISECQQMEADLKGFCSFLT